MKKSEDEIQKTGGRRQKAEDRSQNSGDRMERIPAKNFQDLIVWQKAHQLVLSIYLLSNTFPKQELYGLTSQIRRAVISIPANIAEGFKKKTKPDKVKFMNIAQGSLEECRYYLIFSKRSWLWRYLAVNAST